MTIWDKIYKDYQKGGQAWATLSEEIHPLFMEFLEKSDFKIKHALDIGCGTGKYLKLLQSLGFQTDGIDSSEAAVEMTKQTIGDGSSVECVNMFDYEPPKGRCDLVLSISTIHHGTKELVQKTINNIHEALIDRGRIFITVPDLESGKKWNTFKEHGEVAPGTYVPLSGPEKGLPHSFYTREEVLKLFSEFSDVELALDNPPGRWIVMATK